MNDACQYYIGITKDTYNRLDQHLFNIRKFILTGSSVETADTCLADAMLEDHLYYRHIEIKGISGKALRVVEDTCMISMIAVYGTSGIINVNTGISRKNFNEHGLTH